MNKRRLVTFLLYTYTVLFSAFVFAGNITVKGKVTSQGKALPSVQITDGKTIVTDGKPQVDEDTGLVSYKNAETGKTEQINRDQVKDMSELDN